jgi:hypothetical protein
MENLKGNLEGMELISKDLNYLGPFSRIIFLRQRSLQTFLERLAILAKEGNFSCYKKSKKRFPLNPYPYPQIAIPSSL